MNYFIIPGLKERPKNPDNKMKAEKIMRIVCEFYKTSIDKIISKGRPAEVVTPRHVCIYLIRKHTKLKLRAIAAMLNQKHPTASRADKNIKGFIDSKDRITEEIEQIEAMIK